MLRSAVSQKALCTFVDRDGNPNVFNLNHNGAKLELNANNAKPDNRWNADNKFVFLSRNFLCFSSDFYTGRVFVCAAICPCQPPSIFPTSSSGFEMLIYLLLSNDFVSHRIIISIFSTSSFLVLTFINGSFSIFDENEAPATISIISINILSALLPKEYFWVFGSFSWHSCQSIYVDLSFSKIGKSLSCEIVGGGVRFL